MAYSVSEAHGKLIILNTESDGLIKQVIIDGERPQYIVFKTIYGSGEYLDRKAMNDFYGYSFVECSKIYQVKYHKPSKFSRGDIYWISFEDKNGNDIELCNNCNAMIEFTEDENYSVLRLLDILDRSGFRVIRY